MTQHYTRTTSKVMHWCPTCRRHTMHRVDDRRLGPCTEHAPPGPSKKQEKEREAREIAEQQMGLF